MTRSVEAAWSVADVGLAGGANAVAASQTVLRVVERLASAASDNPRAFADELVGALREALDLEACSFLLNAPLSHALKLKATSGFEYSSYRDFMVPEGTYAAGALTPGLSYSAALAPFDSARFRDVALLEGRNIACGLWVPVRSVGAAGPDPLGVLCLYSGTTDRQRVSELGVTASLMSGVIGRLYVAALQQSLVQLRRQILAKAAFRRDAGSLAYNFIDILRAELPFEAGSVWLWDARKDVLRLYGTTGLRGGLSDRRERDLIERVDSDWLISRVFREGSKLAHSPTNLVFTPDMVLERLQTPLQNGLIMPITVPVDVKIRGRRVQHVGVLVVLNKHSTLGDRTLSTDFTWEDETVVNYATEMLAVLTYQQLRTRDFEADFERKMHGARTNLQSARDHLQMLEQRVDLRAVLPTPYSHFVSNALEWIDDLHNQVNHDEMFGPDELPLQPVALYGDVLTPVAILAQRRAKALDIENFHFKGLGILASSYREIPLVIGNNAALMTVFRNLADNALKYRRAGLQEHWIEFRVASDSSAVLIDVTDNGIGLSGQDLASVFNDGFRGSAARALAPQGQGQGLYDCRRLLAKMNGEISALPSRLGAHFRVRLMVERTSGRNRSKATDPTSGEHLA